MELYIISIRDALEVPSDVCERLFPKRMERARRFRRSEDALRCIGAGLLLEYAGIREADILFTEYGKPYIQGSRRCFSLSHSGDYAVLALDCVPVGVDIEKNAPVRMGVAQRVFTPEELAWMAEKPEKRFYELWTLKESVSKLDGRGLQCDFRAFSVLPMLNGSPILSESGLIYGMTAPIADCTAAVCSEKQPDAVLFKAVTAEQIAMP